MSSLSGRRQGRCWLSWPSVHGTGRVLPPLSNLSTHPLPPISLLFFCFLVSRLHYVTFPFGNHQWLYYWLPVSSIRYRPSEIVLQLAPIQVDRLIVASPARKTPKRSTRHIPAIVDYTKDCIHRCYHLSGCHWDIIFSLSQCHLQMAGAVCPPMASCVGWLDVTVHLSRDCFLSAFDRVLDHSDGHRFYLWTW